MHHREHLQLMLHLSPPDDPRSGQGRKLVFAPQKRRCRQEIFGEYMTFVEQEMGDAGQPYQRHTRRGLLHRAGRQLQIRRYLPFRQAPAHTDPDRPLPTGDLHFKSELPHLFVMRRAGLTSGPFLLQRQQRPKGAGSVHAELPTRHAQTPLPQMAEPGLLASQQMRHQGLRGRGRLLRASDGFSGEKQRGVAAGAPFGKRQCSHCCTLCYASSSSQPEGTCPDAH